MKITKNRYLLGFTATVTFLALTRLVFPGIAKPLGSTAKIAVDHDTAHVATTPVSAGEANTKMATRWYKSDGSLVKNRIFSVPSFKNTFPDVKELVYVGANPFFHVDKLNNSIPYLVPRASILLQDIGRAFYDSLTIKGIPLHKLIVSSVLRTKDDVQKLRNRNQNATENSCHLYGTTFDLCYNRYITVEDPEGPARRAVRNDTLKWVLSEVLRDFRQQERCYIKYEVKQGCFHITVN